MNLNSNPEKTFQDIIHRRKRVIGWGTGSVFERFYPILPVEADYLVDSNPGSWGEKAGLEVRSPETLLEEAKDDIVVVIYSGFVEQISEQLRAMGDFQVVTAGALIGHEEVYSALCAIDSKLHEMELNKSARSSSRAIVITGPLIHEQNLKIIESYAAFNPKDKIILSTWEATHPGLLERAQEVVDFCLLNTPPEHAGFQDRNYQIVLAANGVRKAQQLWQPKFILKTQTDIALLANDLLDSAQDLLGLHPCEVAQQHGLKNRILITDIFTRKYVPYHTSSLVMFGHTEDLYKFWSQPYDNRQLEFDHEDWAHKAIKELSESGELYECFLSRGFGNNLGRAMTGQLEDSWAFYRDFFMVADANWFNLFWLKYPRPALTDFNNEVACCVSSRFWQRLVFDRVSLERINNDQSLLDIKWNEFIANTRNKKSAA